MALNLAEEFILQPLTGVSTLRLASVCTGGLKAPLLGAGRFTTTIITLLDLHPAASKCQALLGRDLTWGVSQRCMEHREVDQGIRGQEEVGDDGGNHVQLRCKRRAFNGSLMRQHSKLDFMPYQ